ncbi:MAG: hypothetical protein IJG23_06105 [Clostridia bacterium]|nr:hypothetical protein [Clostridia bacterium]
MSKYEDRKAVEAALMLKDYCENRDCDVDCVFYKGELFSKIHAPNCAVMKEPWDTALKPIMSKFKELHDEAFESEKGE